MSEFFDLRALSVPSFDTYTADLNTTEVDVIVSVHVSASGIGKWQLRRNDVVVATLFNSSKNLQCEYTIPIPIQYGADKFSIKFFNKDRCPQDLYAGVQTYTNPRIPK